MFVFKILNLFLIVATSCYIGICKSKMFVRREQELKELKNALEIFKSKIEFTYEPIGDIFMEISNMLYGNKENIFKNFCTNLQNEEIWDSWKNSVENTNTHLNEEDKEVLLQLGKLLGKTDKLGQLNEINLVSTFLDRQIETSHEERNKNEKLYKTLGGVAGLTIAIVLL